ncbi:40S ribosomal protein S4 [Spathaspora sp. JA1]|nr:40S ribosomal protein S4 [Spathaspora sp. JA1]
MARGPKKHLKRLAAPSHWMLDKLSGTYAPRPSAGPHKLRESLPLVVFLRNRLKYALNGREVKAILMQQHVKVDAKVRTDSTFPAGFMDVITLEATNEHFRLIYDVKGRFAVHRISAEEASYKLGKVKKVQLGKKGVPYAVTHDGRTIRYPDPAVKANDTVKIDLATGKITDFIKFDTGRLVMVTGGRNLGRVGVIVHREKHEGGFDLVHIKDSLDNTFVTRLSNVFVIGTEAGKPWVSLPKGKETEEELNKIVLVLVNFALLGFLWSYNQPKISEKLLHLNARIRAPDPNTSASASSIYRDLNWNDINFIHTTDTHGWYSGHLNQKQYNANWGDFISFTTHLKSQAYLQGQDLLLIDSGDRHDGNGFSDITNPNGKVSTPIFMKQNYDLLTIGNHELYVWENSRQEYELVADYFGDKYISTNVEYKLSNGTFVPFGQKYKYFTTPVKHLRTLALGFLFDFNRFNNGTRVIPIAEIITQDWFNQVLQEHQQKVDLIIVVTHTPISHDYPELYNLHSHLRQFFPNIIIQYFGGHSHIRDFTVFDEFATGLQSGRYCETIGWTSVNMEGSDLHERFSRSYLDFNLHSFLYHTNKTVEQFDTAKGKHVSQLITETRNKLNLNRALGYVNGSNYYIDYVPIDHKNNIFNLLTSKVLTTLTPNRNVKRQDRIIIINTGSIRYDLYKGPYTIDSQYIVSPFENIWVKFSLPKSVAIQVASKLNDNGYIFTKGQSGSIDNRRLLPPHQYYSSQSVKREESQIPLTLETGKKLTKGYVTHDDFGNDGDDTLHKPVVNFPIPNVVESEQIHSEDDGVIDLVFYDFITPNIVWALNELNYTKFDQTPSIYSSKYLGDLLTEYIQKFIV